MQAARIGARHRLEDRRGLPAGCLVATDPESLGLSPGKSPSSALLTPTGTMKRALTRVVATIRRGVP